MRAKINEIASGAGCRVSAVTARHDRRSHQCATASCHQTLLGGSRVAPPWAPLEASTIKKIPGVVDVENGIDNTTSGTAVVFNVDPVVAARAGFTLQEVELNASAMMQGEPAITPIIQNARHIPSAFSSRLRRAQTLESMQKTVWSAGPARPLPSARLRLDRESPDRPKSFARTSSGAST